MSSDNRHAEVIEKTQRLLDGPLRHVRMAALAAALVPVASVATAQTLPLQINPSGGAVVTVSASCNAYTIGVRGSGLSQSGTVAYSFTITDSGASPATVSGSIPVDPLDSLGDFSASSGGTFVATASNMALFSGAATVSDGISSDTAAIAFEITAECPPPVLSTCPAGPQTANSTLFTNLGAAGPDHFTVLGLGGAGALVNINMATVTGNVGVANLATLKESAPSLVTGDLIIGSSVNTAGVVGRHGPIIVDDALLAQAVHDAEAAADYFASLPSTPSVQAQFPANGQIATALTISGTPGLNVVNLSNFRLNNGSATLTFTGAPGTSFVINDWGNFDLHSGNISVDDGVGPLDIVYNVINPKAAVTTMVPTTAVGILLAPDNAISSMDSARFTGEVIGSYQKTMVLMSGSRVIGPCPQP